MKEMTHYHSLSYLSLTVSGNEADTPMESTCVIEVEKQGAIEDGNLYIYFGLYVIIILFSF